MNASPFGDEAKSEVFLQVANKNGILPNMNKYWSGSHTKHRLMYHLVWIPKYRKRVLTGSIARRIEELLRQCAEVNEWRIDFPCIKFYEVNDSGEIDYSGHWSSDHAVEDKINEKLKTSFTKTWTWDARRSKVRNKNIKQYYSCDFNVWNIGNLIIIMKKEFTIADGTTVGEDKQNSYFIDARSGKFYKTKDLFPDEGHGFAKPENRLKFYGIAEKFLAKHIGGRYEK